MHIDVKTLSFFPLLILLLFLLCCGSHITLSSALPVPTEQQHHRHQSASNITSVLRNKRRKILKEGSGKRKLVSSNEDDEYETEGDDEYEYETEEESNENSSTTSSTSSTSEKSSSSSEKPTSSNKVSGGGTSNSTTSESSSSSSTLSIKSSISSSSSNDSDNNTKAPTTARLVQTGDTTTSSSISKRHEHTNMKHLTKMILKIITTYKIQSMVDIPCRNSLDFMPKLLHTIDFETPGFKYYCIDTDSDSHEDIAHLFSDACSPEILHIKPETASTMPKADLVFLWDGPQDWGVTRFWSFLMHLRQVRPSYVLVTNNPGETNGEKDGVLNLRKQPFHFAQASRVINNVWADESPKKQLLFYEIANIRRGF